MSDLQREKFEAWAVASGYNTMRKDEAAYLMTSTTLSWIAWQAAIESQAVGIHALLEKAGIKYE